MTSVSQQPRTSVDLSPGMSVALGALIASGSLVLGAVAVSGVSFNDIVAVFGIAIIPSVLTVVSAVGFVAYRRRRRRRGQTLRPAPILVVVWSVVGVPVLAIGSHLIPFLLFFEDPYAQAAIAVICVLLIVHGLWISAVISTGIAIALSIRNRGQHDDIDAARA